MPEMSYLIVIEQTETGYPACSPDLLGCVSTGATREEIERNMREAIEFHLEGLKLEGLEIPQPTTPAAPNGTSSKPAPVEAKAPVLKEVPVDIDISVDN